MAEAVLLMGHGGPRSPEEVRPFVQAIAGGRVPETRIQAVIDQYMEIGGRSPFNDLSRQQADALAAALASRGKVPDVLFGTLYSTPSIADALTAFARRNRRRVVCAVMAPHRTEASYEKYRRQVDEAVLQLGTADGAFEFSYIQAWHNHPQFIAALAGTVQQCLPQGLEKASTRLVFTAHSVPVPMSECSNYAGQVDETARLTAQKLGTDNFVVGYQSRSGRPGDAWLEPDVVACLEAAAADGMQQVAVVPIGFVNDNAEVLYDLDVLAGRTANRVGLTFHRAATVGCQPQFIAMLCDLVLTQLEAFYVAERK